MHFELVSLEKVKEQIASGEISLMPSSDDAAESDEESLGDEPIQRGGGSTTKGDEQERWMRLCEMAIVEQDQGKLLSLVNEINRLLEEKTTPYNDPLDAVRALLKLSEAGT